MDTDNDGCPDAKENGPSHLAGGERDPNDPWDFADVPAPALLPSNTVGVRDRTITLTGDVLAVLKFVGSNAASPNTPNAFGATYGSDLNANGTQDGAEYDRTASANPAMLWRTGPPDGAISLSGDVLPVLKSVGDAC